MARTGHSSYLREAGAERRESLTCVLGVQPGPVDWVLIAHGGFLSHCHPLGDGWPNVMARYNHETGMLLGTTKAGTLRLEVDGTGLLYEVTPPSHRRDVVELVERGDVTQSSFAFVVREDDWSLGVDGIPERRLLAVQLVDVAPVTAPAYLDTSVALRSLGDRFDVADDDLDRLSQRRELRRLFPKRLSGIDASAAILARSQPW